MDVPESLSRRSLRVLARMAGRAPAGANRGVQGFVDALVNGDTVVGWARDMRDPLRRLEIQVLHGKKVMGFGIADVARKDLLAQDMGDGRYGFRLRLAPVLLDGAARTITVCAVTERGKVPLQRGELTVAARPAESAAPKARAEPEPAASPSSRSAAQTMVGALERLNGRALQGWAFNPDHPDAPALVDIYDDERYLGSVMADRSRPRLYEKGFPSGARGFVFELPADIEATASGRLRARVADTAYDLRRSRDFPTETTAPQADPVGEPRPSQPPPYSPPADPTPPTDPHPTEPVRPRAPANAAAPAQAITLWPVGKGEGGPATLADWAGQRHPAIRAATGADGADLPARLGSDPIPVTGKSALLDVTRQSSFVLFATVGTRLDAELAGSLAGLPGMPDVVLLDGDRPFACGETARVETVVAPTRIRPVAVRADVLAAYPGDLRRELDGALLSPLLLWLAGRGDLIWAMLAAPGATPVTEPHADRRERLWRAALDEQVWTVAGPILQPKRAVERISIALWQGWDDPALPALRALAESADVPLDVMVPTEGDAARADARLAAAEQAIAAGVPTGARARIIDCAPGALAVIRAMLDGADGETILLTDGAATLAPGDLARMAFWALHPHVGAVGMRHASGWSSGSVLARGPAIRPAAHTDGADMISFGLAMVASAHVAAVGLPDAIDGSLDLAALGWARQMARNGFHAALLPGGADGSQPPAMPRPGPLPWHAEAWLRANGLLDLC